MLQKFFKKSDLGSIMLGERQRVTARQLAALNGSFLARTGSKNQLSLTALPGFLAANRALVIVVKRHRGNIRVTRVADASRACFVFESIFNRI
jgi:hypothetical protein